MKYIKLKLSVVGFFMALFVFAANAQQITVSGVVRDARSGEEIIGANIIERGTTHGTITDVDGNFRFSVASDATLVVSFMGYETQEIALQGRTSLTINLGEDTRLLDELIVIGYGAVRRGDATGSATAIRPDEINRGLITNPQELLLGRVAGVQVTTEGGLPGARAEIRIRGGSSLNASNDPLIVIDGFPLDNDGVRGVANQLAMINPNDIETFTVLRDASATAIFGSRGSNGVIIITTRRGSASARPQVTYSGNVSISTIDNRLEAMSANQFRNHIQTNRPELVGNLGDANTNWQDEIFRTAFATDHNLTVTGGRRNMPYRVSAGYTNMDGILNTSNMERFTGSASISPVFFDNHLSFNINTRAMHIRNRFADTGAVGAALAMDPTRPVRMPDDERYDVFGGFFQTLQPGTALGDPEWLFTNNPNTPQNPVAFLRWKDDRSRSNVFITNIEGVYRVHGVEGLTLHTNFGADFSNGEQTTIYSPFSFGNNYFGRNNIYEEQKRNFAFNSFIQYNQNLGNHRFNIMGGYEWQRFHRVWERNMRNYFQPTHPENPGGVRDVEFQPFGGESFLVSFFSRANYIIADRYMFTATVRADGSSKLAPGSRWGIFPSFAFAWNMHEEDFLRDVRWLSELKPRVGYGITGQQNLGDDYFGLILYRQALEYAWGTLGQIDPNTGEHIFLPTLRPEPFNLNLTWETTTTYNIGLDFGFMRGRFTGSIDAYYRLTTNLINRVEIPVGTNFSNEIYDNIGSLSNAGIEFALNAVAVNNRQFRWDIGFTAAYNRNRIEELTLGGGGFREAGDAISSGTGIHVQRFQEGLPAHTFFVFPTRVNEHGVWEIITQNEDGVPTEADLVPFHDPMPDLMLGLTSNMQFGNFDFSFTVRSNIGVHIYNDMRASRMINFENIYREGAFTNLLVNTLDPFSRIEHSPNISLGSNAFLIDRFVENASFVRVDNITLGYSFSKWGANARVFGTVQNPIVLTRYTGIDPEITNNGIDNGIFPRAITAILGISLQF